MTFDGLSLDTTQLVALAGALGWASGMRLYAVVFLTGLAGWLGWVTLPPGLHLLQQSRKAHARRTADPHRNRIDEQPDHLFDAVHFRRAVPGVVERVDVG